MDLKEELGASTASTVSKFSIYLPSCDRQGRPIDGIEDWIDFGLQMMGQINGGATCTPPAKGIWVKKSKKSVAEDTQVLYSFLRRPRAFKANLKRIKVFLHSFGKFTNQGEVMVEFSSEDSGKFISRAYYIDMYTDASDLMGKAVTS
jgi:hypothetical protein